MAITTEHETTGSLDAVIGDRVHQLMWRQRMTQTELARRLGVEQPTLSRKLRGVRRWTVDEVAAAAAVLGVSVQDLFGELPRLDSNQKPAGYRRHLRAVS